jgi:glycine dehydrogenase
MSIAGEWDHPYDRMTAVFPPGVDPARKYWPSVRRIDGVYGDRHLLTTVPAPETPEG